MEQQTMKRIDLAQKNSIGDVINKAIYLHCDVIKAPLVQTWFVYFYFSAQPLSTNFDQVSKLCFDFTKATKNFHQRAPIKRDHH